MLSANDYKKVEYSDLAFISDIRDRLVAACSDSEGKKLTLDELYAFLMGKDYIKTIEFNGQQVKVPTEKGLSCGIVEYEKTSETTGKTYKRVKYPEAIQREIAGAFVQSTENNGF